MPNTTTGGTRADATAFGSQRKIDRCQNGVQWTLGNYPAQASFAFSATAAYSTDNGATWNAADNIGNGSGATGTSYVTNGSFFIDVDDYAHWVFKDNQNGFLYYRRGTPNAARTAYTWSARTLVLGNASDDNPDIVMFRDPASPGGWIGSVVSWRGGNGAVWNSTITVTSAGVVSVSSAVIGGGTTAVSAFPSVDFNHTGDGKTVAGGTPHLYVAWSAGTTGATGSGAGIRFRKATYSGGSWTWGTEREIDTTRVADAAYGIPCMFDGTRVIIAGHAADAGNTGSSSTVVFERDAADTTTTVRAAAASTDPAAALLWGTAAYDGAGNVYVFGASGGAAGSRIMGYRRWVRATSTLEAKVTLDPTVGTPYVSARRGPQGGAIDYVYTDGTASPYTVTSGRITLNTAPNAGGKPSPDGVAVDRTSAATFSYAFSDPDAGDTPSRTDWRWRTSPVTGTPGAWNTTTISGTSTSITYPASTFPAGRIELQDLPYDSQGVVAPTWSDSAFVTAADPPTAVTFASPAAGSTIPTPSVTATITTTNLDALVWEVRGDTAGTANATVIASGTIEDPAARAFSVTGLANGTTVHLRARRRVNGLLSPWADNGAQLVSFTPPPAAVLTLTPVPASAKLAVGYTIPAPTGSEPAVTGVDVYVDDGTAEVLRRIAGTGAVDRSPTASPWVHDTPALGREYGAGTGRVVVVVKGANGTTRTTAS